jgi:hypothetical protein
MATLFFVFYMQVRYVSKKTVGKAERARFLDRQGEESEISALGKSNGFSGAHILPVS